MDTGYTISSSWMDLKNPGNQRSAVKTSENCEIATLSYLRNEETLERRGILYFGNVTTQRRVFHKRRWRNWHQIQRKFYLQNVENWHENTIPIIESFVVNNKSVVKFLLQKAECPELMLTAFEYNLLKELLDFLKNFQVVTAILSGSKYATHYVMFRQEIRSLLESEPQESIEIKELKDNMMKKFAHRFPLSDETLLASEIPKLVGSSTLSENWRIYGCGIHSKMFSIHFERRSPIYK